MSKNDNQSLGDLFQNAGIRREAIAQATGEARPDPNAQPAMPWWRKKLMGLEQQTARLPWRQMSQTCILLVALAVGYWGWQNRAWLNDRLTTAIAEATGATVQKIEVTGLVNTPQPDLLQALQLKRGSSLVGFDASAARARLEALPWVRLASVERQLPATVKVQVYEHVPLARMISGTTGASEVWVLNAQGTGIIADSANTFVGLPLLQGAGAPAQAAALFNVLQPHGNLLNQLREAEWVGNRRWDLRFVSGVTVLMPEGRAAEAMALLQRLEEARHVLTLNDGTVDLRLADRIVLRLPATVPVTPVTTRDTSPSEAQ